MEKTEAPPLTDEKLDGMESDARLVGIGGADSVLRLVAEVRRLRAQQTPGSEAPPTEADLERVLELALGDMSLVEGDRCVGAKEHAKAQAEQDDVEHVIRGAINELRRLRSDEWLQRAAEEIAQRSGVKTLAVGPWVSRDVVLRDGEVLTTQALPEAEALAILRKHRDGLVLGHAFIPDHHAGQTCAFVVGDHKYCGKTEAEHRDGKA